MRFQFHVTLVDLPVERKERFLELCQIEGVKPVLIELEKGEHIRQPMFTRNLDAERLDAALAEVQKTSDKFVAAGFEISRVKAEIDPRQNADYLSDERYYEWHCLVRYQDEEELKALCREREAHLSRNALNPGEKFVSIRFYDKDAFYQAVEKTEDALKLGRFEIVKEKFEYSVYDSRLELDKGWA
ncbi:MAG: hypothetical protein IJM30_11015 [Thermoguttaceae bacterium]|nr:hypothetical protein [Thermoguttaceae bacterium]